MKSQPRSVSQKSSITNWTNSILYPFVLVATISLAGCQQSPVSNEATLDVSNVQGSSFDEPATSPLASAPETSPAASPAAATTTPLPQVADLAAATAPDVNTSASVQDPNNPFPVVASAADIPDDISKIPTSTPEPVKQTPVPDPASATIAAAPQAPVATGNFEPVSFKTLSGFKYEEPIPNEGDKPEDVEKRRTEDQIPADVKSLNGKKSVVQGWMVPMEINEDGSVKSFVLVKTQPQCCFGDMQAMNEWIDVAMVPGKTAEFNVDIPVKVYGDLEVGEKKEDGFVLSIYRMKGERVEL